MSGMRTSLTAVGVVCIGYGLWVVTSPSEERKREILKNLPEANAVNMDEARKRNAMIMQVLKKAAQTDENIARRTGPPKSEP